MKKKRTGQKKLARRKARRQNRMARRRTRPETTWERIFAHFGEWERGSAVIAKITTNIGRTVVSLGVIVGGIIVIAHYLFGS